MNILSRVRAVFSRQKSQYVAPPLFDDAALSVAQGRHRAGLPSRSIKRVDLRGNQIGRQYFYHPCTCGVPNTGDSASDAARRFREHQEQEAIRIYNGRLFAEIRDEMEPVL